MKTYKDLEVYNRSYNLAVEIHKISLKFPSQYKYDLGDQIRRASRSIPSNIAEGLGRNQSVQDKIHFLKIALGSNDEMLFNLSFLKDINLLNPKISEYFSKEYEILGKQLFMFIKKLETSN